MLLWYWLGEHLRFVEFYKQNVQGRKWGPWIFTWQLTVSKEFSKACPNHCLLWNNNNISHTPLSLKLVFSKHSALLNNILLQSMYSSADGTIFILIMMLLIGIRVVCHGRKFQIPIMPCTNTTRGWTYPSFPIENYFTATSWNDLYDNACY
jgi:hypothetical protein